MKAQRVHPWLMGGCIILVILLPQVGLAQSLDQWQGTNPWTQGHSLRISYGNRMFVAAGESGALYTSSDGADWKERTSGTGQFIKDVAFGGGTFVAVGGGGLVLTSPDGVTWRFPSSGTGYDFHGVAYGKSTFVAVGDRGLILASPDGSAWAVRDSGTHQSLKKVAYGNGTFVAVGDNGILLTSPDGEAWTERNSGVRGNLEGIAYGKKTFVVVGEVILTSPDGRQWTERAAGKNHHVFGVAYGSGVFAAVADNGAIFTSSDGSEWTPRDSGTHLTLYSIAYGKQKFLASGEKGVLLQSEPLPSPQISVSSTSLDFGSVPVGDSSFTSLTIANSGSANLLIRQIVLSGADASDFNTRNDNCTGATLTPSQNCIVQIVFSPRSTGSKSATLSISSNDPDNATQDVSLSGSGTDRGISIGSGSTGGFCFISTSVKGSGFEGYLDILRKFRDSVLGRSHWGRTWVSLYYRHSPGLNRLLAGHEFLRKAVAVGLVPSMAAIAYVTLYTSPAEKSILFLLMAVAMTAGWGLIGKSALSRDSQFLILSLWRKQG